MYATKRSAENIVGSMVLVIGLPIHFVFLTAQKGPGWEIWSFWSLWSLFELWAPISVSQFHLFRTKGYRDANASEKLQLTESAIIKHVCTRI